MGLEPQVWAEWNANRSREIKWEGYNGWRGTRAGTHARTPDSASWTNPFQWFSYQNTCKASLHPPGNRLDNSFLGKLNIPREICLYSSIHWRLKVLQWKNWEPCQISLQKSLPADQPYLHKTSSQCCSASPKYKRPRHLRKATPLKETD